MKAITSRIFWGLLLVVGGAIFLLQSLGIIELGVSIIALLFAAAAAAFLVEFFSNRESWWAVIPGLVLLGVAGTIAQSTLFPFLPDAIGGVLINAMIGLAFWIIFIVRRDFWWAIIPAGVMTTISIMILIGDLLGGGVAVAGIFFMGLAATFALLAVIPTSTGKMRWPLIPAAILFVFGVAITTFSTDVFNLLWPVLLILGGLFLFFFRRPAR